MLPRSPDRNGTTVQLLENAPTQTVTLTGISDGDNGTQSSTSFTVTSSNPT